MKPVKTLVKQVNVRILLAILAVGAITTVAVAVVHRIQVRRNAAGLADLARAKLSAGNVNDAIGLFSRYLTYRPNDAGAQAELARLLVELAESPKASNNDRLWAYDVLETAVSKNQHDRALRTKLADWMIKSGRMGPAGEQLDILLGNTDGGDAGDVIDDEERDTLLVLRARAHLGTGEYPQAARILAGVCGFDLETKKFRDDSTDQEPSAQPSPAIYQASVILAALLEEKLRDAPAGRRVLDRLVETHPDDFRAWLARANWHRTHGQFAAATEDLSRAREISPDDVGVLFTSFELALAEGRVAEAEQLVRRGRSLFPRDERVFRGLAAVAVQQGDLDRAVTVLQEAVNEKLDDYFRLKLMLADLLLQMDRLDDAEKAIADFAEQFGDRSAEAGLLQARLLIARRSWLPARKKLEAVRPLVATSDEMTKQVDIYLAQCHEQLGDFDEQLSANRRVLSQDHTSVVAQIGAAAALATAGRMEESLREYEAIAASLTPDRLAAMPQVWSPLLQLRVADQMKRPESERDWARIDSLLEQLELSPSITSTQLALLRSDTLVRKGQPAEAENLLRDQVKADPQSPQALASLMLLTARNRGAEAARGLLADAPADVLDSPAVMLAEAQLVARTAPRDAAALFAKLEEKAESMPAGQAGQMLASIGFLRRGLGDADEAERLWKASLGKQPENLPIHLALLELAADRGDVEKTNAAAANIGRLAGEASPQGRVAAATAMAVAVRARRVALGDRAAMPQSSGGTVELSAEDKAQLTAAYNLLVEAENDRPGWAPIQKLFAEIAALRSDVPEAIDRLQQAARLNPADPSVLRRLLSLLYLSNRLDEAHQTLAKLGPEGLSGMERLSAEVELSYGQIDSAVGLAERSLAANENATSADLLWFGQLLARAGKADRALEVLQRAVDADPKRAEGWLALISMQFMAGQRRLAERTLEKAGIALDPPQRQLVLAQGSELLGRLDESGRYFREAVAVDPDSTAAARSLASFLIRRGQLAAARDELRAIIDSPRSDPDSLALRAWARRTMAVLMSQTGAYRQAEEAMALIDQNAADGTPGVEDLTLKIGILAGRPEPAGWRRAIDLSDQLAKLRPLSNAQRIQRVQLLEKCGRWEEARNELVSMLSRPNPPQAVHMLLIEKLIQHGERDSAKIWLKQLADRFPDAPAVFALKAKLAMAENDRPAAAEAARRLMPDDARAVPPEQLGAVAALMEQLGFIKAANKLFERYEAADRSGTAARAAFLGRQHRTDESLDLLERAWDRIPLLTLMQTAVTVLRAQGNDATPQQRERVEQWFEKADLQDPGSASLALLRADLHAFNGRDEQVVAVYRALLSRTDLPSLQTAVVANNLAFSLARPDTAAEAEKLIDTAIVELGPSPDVLDTRGVVLLAAGKTSEAIAVLKEAVLDPSATKYLHLACALVAERQVDAARGALAEAKKLGLDPQTLTADDRLRLDAVEAAIGS